MSTLSPTVSQPQHHSKSALSLAVQSRQDALPRTPLTTAQLTYDANGNVSELLDPTGTITAHYEHDPFGQETTATGPAVQTNPYRFTKPSTLATFLPVGLSIKTKTSKTTFQDEKTSKNGKSWCDGQQADRVGKTKRFVNSQFKRIGDIYYPKCVCFCRK